MNDADARAAVAAESGDGEPADAGSENATYLVAIKRSARKTNARAGEYVNREGARREFDSKALAREWAREIGSRGARVWIQDAAPTDRSPVDGYLVGGRRRGGNRSEPGTQTAIEESGG